MVQNVLLMIAFMIMEAKSTAETECYVTFWKEANYAGQSWGPYSIGGYPKAGDIPGFNDQASSLKVKGGDYCQVYVCEHELNWDTHCKWFKGLVPDLKAVSKTKPISGDCCLVLDNTISSFIVYREVYYYKDTENKYNSNIDMRNSKDKNCWVLFYKDEDFQGTMWGPYYEGAYLSANMIPGFNDEMTSLELNGPSDCKVFLCVDKMLGGDCSILDIGKYNNLNGRDNLGDDISSFIVYYEMATPYSPTPIPAPNTPPVPSPQVVPTTCDPTAACSHSCGTTCACSGTSIKANDYSDAKLICKCDPDDPSNAIYHTGVNRGIYCMRHFEFQCSAVESYKLLWIGSYPSCDNLWTGSCFTALTVTQAQEQCDIYPDCIGFSWFDNRGCFKKNQNCNGLFGTGSYNYYVRCSKMSLYKSNIDYLALYKQLGSNKYPSCDNLYTGSCFTALTVREAEIQCNLYANCIGFSWNSNNQGCLKKNTNCGGSWVVSGYDYYERTEVSGSITYGSTVAIPSNPSQYYIFWILISACILSVGILTLNLIMEHNKKRYKFVSQ